MTQERDQSANIHQYCAAAAGLVPWTRSAEGNAEIPDHRIPMTKTSSQDFPFSRSHADLRASDITTESTAGIQPDRKGP